MAGAQGVVSQISPDSVLKLYYPGVLRLFTAVALIILITPSIPYFYHPVPIYPKTRVAVYMINILYYSHGCLMNIYTSYITIITIYHVIIQVLIVFCQMAFPSPVPGLSIYLSVCFYFCLSLFHTHTLTHCMCEYEFVYWRVPCGAKNH